MPDLKRGALSLEEEKLIVELHSVVGNRWSQIAAQLQGRSDNEIKNLWNSCLIKKLKQRGIDPNTQVVTQLAQKASNAATESSGAENIEFFKDISSFGIGGYGLNSKNSSLSFNSISSSFLPSSKILSFVPSSSPSTTLNPIRHSSDVKEDRIQGQAEINKCSQYQYSPVLLGSSIAKANQTSSYEDLLRPLDTYFN